MFLFFFRSQVPHRGGDRAHVAVKKFNKDVKETIQGLNSQNVHGWDYIRNFATHMVRNVWVPVPGLPTRINMSE